MADVLLIILGSIAAFLMFIFNIYLFVIYCHPTDLKFSEAIFSKTIVIISSTTVWVLLFLIPIDISNSKGMDIGFNLSGFYEVMIWITISLIFIVLPLTIFIYESDDEKPFFRRFCGALFGEMLIASFFGGFLILTWKCFNKATIADLNVVTFENALLSEVSLGNVTSLQISQNIIAQKIQYDIPFFLLAVVFLIIVSWVLFVTFFGVGLGSLSVDMIYNWIDRPKPKTAKAIAEEKLELREKTNNLMAKMKRFEDPPETTEKPAKKAFFGGWFEKKHTKISEKQLKIEFEKLNDEYDLFKAEQNLGFNPLWSLISLLFGIIFGVFSILILLQIILGQLIRVNGVPVWSFLSHFFQFVERKMSGFVTVVITLVFVFAILVLVIKGVTTFGFRFFCCISLYPLKLGKTLINSFLFNILVLLTCVPAIMHFVFIILKSFLYRTSGVFLFETLIHKVKLISWIFDSLVMFYALLIWSLISFGYFVCKNKCKKTNEKKDIKRKDIEI